MMIPSMRLRWRRHTRAERVQVTHDQAIAELKALEHSKERLDKYEENPNDGYKTPFNSSAYPGLDI